ncbi:MAG: hypothetical protein J3T61_00320 [Candidatus Brocadiales bacterium]|nr:hypothetical protein [Candidatus Bathyanammoxibius sp.]
MNYPKSLKIGHLDYALNEIDAGNIPGASGLFHMGSGQILLANDMDGGYAVKVLLHEVLHGIWGHYSMDDGSLNEERIVDTFANGLCTVIRDNPGFAAWLAEHLEKSQSASSALGAP